LEYGADLKMRGRRSETPLHSAIKAGKIDLVRILLEIWPEGQKETDNFGNTQLHWAARMGQTDLVRLLMELWLDGKEALKNNGQTPLSMLEKLSTRRARRAWLDEGGMRCCSARRRVSSLITTEATAT
jgi:ankyrin repeat protein